MVIFHSYMLNYQRVLNQLCVGLFQKTRHIAILAPDSEEITEMASQERPKVNLGLLLMETSSLLNFVDRETFIDSMDMQ